MSDVDMGGLIDCSEDCCPGRPSTEGALQIEAMGNEILALEEQLEALADEVNGYRAVVNGMKLDEDRLPNRGEWEAHRAFYKVTVDQRNAAWRSNETMRAELAQLQQEYAAAQDDLSDASAKLVACSAVRDAMAEREDALIELVERMYEDSGYAPGIHDRGLWVELFDDITAEIEL